MLQSSKLLRSAWHHHQLPSQKLHHHHPQQTLYSTPTCKFSRRELAIFTNTSLLLLVSSQSVLPNSHAEEQNQLEETINGNDATPPEEGAPTPANPVEDDEIQSQISDENTTSSTVEDAQPTSKISQANNKIKEPVLSATKRAFLDISIDGKPTGRITVAIDNEKTPIGASRFIDLVSGRAGISYRRKEFVKITPNYVQHGGVRSYGVDAEMARSTGKDLSNGDLIHEWEKMISESSTGTKNFSGRLGIIVRDPRKPPPKTKLVARQGKLKVEEEEVGVEPNGTEFVIAAKDSPELDDSALVIGRVIEGMDVVDKIRQVKTVQENTTSPYFRVAKLIGDKRAVVAERGFNRPYSKVVVTNCGLLD